MYIVTSLGFVRQSFDVLVDGIEKSIIQAHENLRPGSIFVNKGKGGTVICASLFSIDKLSKIFLFLSNITKAFKIASFLHEKILNEFGL